MRDDHHDDDCMLDGGRSSAADLFSAYRSGEGVDGIAGAEVIDNICLLYTSDAADE